MGMFNYLSESEKLIIAIENRYITIEFENDEYIKEDIEILQRGDNYKNKILIRNRGTGGSNDTDIPHNPTIKFIKGNEFKHNGNLGLPFDISEDFPVRISPDADTKRNRDKLNKNDKAFVKLIGEENKKEIIEYFYLDKNNIEDRKRMKEIEEKILDKYGDKRVKLKKTEN